MAYNVTIFGINLTLHPVAFSIPIGAHGWDIYWYGIIIATGFLLALLYGFKTAPRFGVDPDRMLDVILVTTPVAILCARTYYVLFDGEKLNGIKDFFGFGESSGFAGLAIYGGVIGAFACGALMCYLRKVKVLDMFDIAAAAFLLAQGIGRWGNFMNQEAYGTFTGSSWWGMESTRTIAEMGEGLVHPCFLYESVWCIIGFFVLRAVSKRRTFSGEITLCYGVWYGFERGFLELVRTDSLMIGNLRVSSVLSFILCIASAIALAVIRGRMKNAAADETYTAVFSAQTEPESDEETEEIDEEIEEIEEEEEWDDKDPDEEDPDDEEEEEENE